MRRFMALAISASLLPAVALAQTTPTGGQTQGEISVGAQQVDNSTNSSKFGEYRDFRSDRFPLNFWFSTDQPSGFYAQAAGDGITRRDQRFSLELGNPGRWRLNAGWHELPHNFSNRAVTPYTETSPGVLDVTQTMNLPIRRLATAAGDIPMVLRSDTIAAAWAMQMSRPTELENITRTGSVQLRYNAMRALELSAGFTRRTKTGNELSYGPIGDRPPRTLNIQLAEPVDYVTGDFNAAAEYVQRRYQVRAELLVSRFENEVDVLTWRNVWVNAPAGASYVTWDRVVATYGRRPLAPDNRYHTASLSGGLALPLESRLTATVARGYMRQDEELLPYAFQSAEIPARPLPRSTADARINTTQANLEYFIAPVRRVNLRAFYRWFDLDNETPSSNWQYVTQDATSLNGGSAYVNKRTNEPFSWERQNLGLEATLRLGLMASSLTLGAEREIMDREHRQASHTSENILRASWRARPANWLSLRTTLQRGVRDGGEYNWRSPSESYWYEAAERTDNNDPRFTFEDHPDMRKYDMADRQRDRAELTVTLTPRSNFSLSTSYRLRRDDYDSDVVSVQPLRGLETADSLAVTPGDQLGLLRADSRQFSVDLAYTPTARLDLNGSVGYDRGTSDIRSIEYNENNKRNPSAVATADLGPWTRRTSQWTADSEDRTRFASLGGNLQVLPGVRLQGNYMLSFSDLDIEYGGFGLLNWDGTPYPENNQFQFSTPPTVEQRTHTANVGMDWAVRQNLGVRLGWTYESYRLRDWQQGAGIPQFEEVNTPLYLRDTSRSFQWGNRLLNMGEYLAPSFTGHALYVGLSYRFGGSGGSR